MASFLYIARETASGREIRSSVDASTEQAAIAALLNRNMLVLSIQEKVGKQGKTSGGRVGLGDLVIFTRQLATMVDAGLAMVQSLQALADQTTNKVMRDTIRDVCARVENGDSFSEALQKHPKAFSRLYVCMVGAGEKGGLLAEILARLAVYLENTARLRKKVKAAMMYPTVVTVVAILITVFLLIKVVPVLDRKSTRLNSSHRCISYAHFCLEKPDSGQGSGLGRAREDTAGHHGVKPGMPGRAVLVGGDVARADVGGNSCSLFFFLKSGAPPGNTPLPSPYFLLL